MFQPIKPPWFTVIDIPNCTINIKIDPAKGHFALSGAWNVDTNKVNGKYWNVRIDPNSCYINSHI